MQLDIAKQHLNRLVMDRQQRAGQIEELASGLAVLDVQITALQAFIKENTPPEPAPLPVAASSPTPAPAS
jgi:hypothetical protein